MKSRTKMPETPSNQDLSNQKFLSYLLATRELKQFWELGEKMVKAGKGKKDYLLEVSWSQLPIPIQPM